MIHEDPQIIEPETLALLNLLMSDDNLSDFFLVGGTALALQIGHRLSIDLDLFSELSFNSIELNDYLSAYYSFNTTAIRSNTLLGFINEIKVDFISHQYALVKPLILREKKRFASLLDIGAMKLNAVGQSGQRQKDFYDIYYLLQYYSLSDLLSAYASKYPRSSTLIPIRGLSYFDDIKFEIEPPIQVEDVPFSKVRSRLLEAVQHVDQVFLSR